MNYWTQSNKNIYVAAHRGWKTKYPYVYGYCACVLGIMNGEISIDDAKQLQKETGIRLWAGTYATDEKKH